MRPHPSLRLVAAPALLALALTACSSSSAKTAASDRSSTPPAASAAGSSLPSGSAKPAASAAPARSTAPTAGTTGRPSTRATSPSARSTGGPRATAAAGVAPGTYTYGTTGTVTYLGSTKNVSDTTSFTVGALSGGSQHTEMKNSYSTTDEQLVPRSDGMYVSDLKLSAPPAIDAEFVLSPAKVLFPAAAKVGATWGWTATSTDGKTTATQTSKVLRTETLVIGGQRVQTVVVQTHLVLSGSTSYTADITNWVAPSYRLVVKDHQVGKGSYFSNDLTDVLRSVHPS